MTTPPPTPTPPTPSPHTGLRRSRRRHFGLTRYCPICRSLVRGFGVFGVRDRPDAQCPVCGSLERHRLTWLYLQQSDLLQPPTQSFLHVSPEGSLQSVLQHHPAIHYVATDLLGGATPAPANRHQPNPTSFTMIYAPDMGNVPRLSCQTDLTRAGFRAASFDVVYCSHVLEHIPDDHAAMREMRRILKPHGWALIDVPIAGAHTDEDLTVTDPAERERRFGQADHVRQYGRDIVTRLAAGGFAVETLTADAIVPPARMRWYGIKPQLLFRCTPRP